MAYDGYVNIPTRCHDTLRYTSMQTEMMMDPDMFLSSSVLP